MTDKEKKLVIEICSKADNGCGPCVGVLYGQLIEKLGLTFEEIKKYHPCEHLYNKVYRDEFGEIELSMR